MIGERGPGAVKVGQVLFNKWDRGSSWGEIRRGLIIEGREQSREVSLGVAATFLFLVSVIPQTTRGKPLIRGKVNK